MSRTQAKVVVAGGGVAALEVLLGLDRLVGDRVDVQLLCPRSNFVYRPLALTEPFGGPPAPCFDLTELLRAADLRQVTDELIAVDTLRRVAGTALGAEIEFDAAVVAVGARTEPVFENAITFTRSAGVERMSALLAEIARGAVKRLAFVVPPGVVWALPLYELALLTAEWIESRAISDVEMLIYTHEQAPLRMFGAVASRRIAEKLRDLGIVLHANSLVDDFDGEHLSVAGDGRRPADRVVSIPRLTGRRIDGLEHDENGFLRTDGHGLVSGTLDVYAAGDITSFPVKQAVIAAQQADAVVRSLAARFGAEVEPTPFRPMLRGLSFGGGPTFVRTDIGGVAGEAADTSVESPPADRGGIVGVYLSEFLAGTDGEYQTSDAAAG